MASDKEKVSKFNMDNLAKRVERLMAEKARLRFALEESVKLQTHYAALLNMHDGSMRTLFKDADEWLARLKQMAAPASGRK